MTKGLQSVTQRAQKGEEDSSEDGLQKSFGKKRGSQAGKKEGF